MFEEQDAPGEWYYDGPSATLYLSYNGTGAPPRSVIAVLADQQVLVNASGSQDDAIVGLSFLGLGFRDSAYSYLA